MRIREGFQEEIESLQRRLLAMGGLITEQILGTMNAMLYRDNPLAEEVIDRDQQVIEYGVDVTEQCLQLLEFAGAEVGDLHFITTAMKIVADLERIGAQAVNIARHALVLNRESHLKPLADLPRVAERALNQVTESLNAFVRRDADLARPLCAGDPQADALRDRILEELISQITSNPRTTPRAIRIILITHFLERVADRATNIAEMVVDMVEGKTILNRPLP